jgi:hypothetical protein
MHRRVENATRQKITIQTAHSDLGKFGKQTGAAFGARYSWGGLQGKNYCLSVQQLDIFSRVKRFSNVSCSVNSLAIGAMTPKLSERFASDAQMRRSAWTLNFEHNAIPELGTTAGPKHSTHHYARAPGAGLLCHLTKRKIDWERRLLPQSGAAMSVVASRRAWRDSPPRAGNPAEDIKRVFDPLP